MEKYYKLKRVRELADNDEDFIKSLVTVFLEEVPEDIKLLKKAVTDKDYYQAYQTAHKLKPTIDLFELGVLEEIIEVQDWGKFEKKDQDITKKFNKVLRVVDKTITELKQDFNL